MSLFSHLTVSYLPLSPCFIEHNFSLLDDHVVPFAVLVFPVALHQVNVIISILPREQLQFALVLYYGSYYNTSCCNNPNMNV